MAIRLIGWMPACTMSDNGAGKVRVTFPAATVDHEYYAEVLTDGSWYVANTTTAVAGAITAKGGSEAAGYYFDIGGTAYPSANFNTNDLCCPILGNTINAYATVALAFAASATMDRWIVCYADANLRRYWFEQVSDSTTTCCSITGLLPNRGVVFFWSVSDWYYMVGDLSGITSQLKIDNLKICETNEGNQFTIYYNDTSAAGEGLRVTRCHMHGGYFAVYFSASKNGVLQIDRSICDGTQYGIGLSSPGCKAYNCTSVANLASNYRISNATAPILTNCYGGGVAAGGGDFVKTGGANPVATYCSSADDTADDWGGVGNRINDYIPNMKFWGDNVGATLPVEDFRILTTSPLYHAGTNLGLLLDCDGNPVDGATPSIGWHEGTVNAYDVLWHDPAKVVKNEYARDFAGALLGTGVLGTPQIMTAGD